MSPLREFIDQAGQILTRGDHADRAGQDKVEEQRRHGNAGEKRAHRVADHNVDAAPNKHGGTLHIERAHREAEQHDAQHEPGGAAANCLFSDAAGVKRGRRQITEYDGGGSPERNKSQRDGGGDYYFCAATCGRGSHSLGGSHNSNATHRAEGAEKTS